MKKIKKEVESLVFYNSEIEKLNNEVCDVLDDRMNEYDHVKITSSELKIAHDEYHNRTFYKDLNIECWNNLK